jgi:hypothetical protein
MAARAAAVIRIDAKWRCGWRYTRFIYTFATSLKTERSGRRTLASANSATRRLGLPRVSKCAVPSPGRMRCVDPNRDILELQVARVSHRSGLIGLRVGRILGELAWRSRARS